MAIFLGGFLLPAWCQPATNLLYQTLRGTALSVPVPGVLVNEPGGMTASVTSGPSNGQLTFNRNGSFNYIPTNNFTGEDGFVFRTSIGAQGSVEIMVLAPGELFDDNFSRPVGYAVIFPWLQKTDGIFVRGSWNVTGNQMNGTSPFNSYGYAFYQNANWSNYTVQAQVRFSTPNAASAGILGRLNPATGAHYAVWIYPEGSSELDIAPGNGTAVLELIKYESWTNYSLIGTNVVLPGIGTNLHNLKLTFQGSVVSAFFDSALEKQTNDNGSIDGQPAYLNGGVGLNMWTLTPAYTFSVDNVIVTTNGSVANNDSYTVTNSAVLQVSAPGILANDAGSGILTAMLVHGPGHGILTLTNNGGFTYTATNGYLGTDSFTYRATDGATTTSVATVSITLVDSVTANNDFYTIAAGTTLSVPVPGILGNDQGGVGPLSALLANAPVDGNLMLTNPGGFTYTPAANFQGVDGFTYLATDGETTSSLATAGIMVVPNGNFFYDNFARPAGGSSIFPWVDELGFWGITNGVMTGTCSFNSYGDAYYDAKWTDYAVQAQIKFSSTNGWGGAVAGRLNPATGARYTVWVFPENSPWAQQNGVSAGLATMQIIKHETWASYTATNLVVLPGVGTNWHSVRVSFQSNSVTAFFDGTQVTKIVDDGTFDGQAAFASGGISMDMWTASPVAYSMSVSNVVVLPVGAVPPPVILSSVLTNGATALTWSSVPGAIYGIQSSTNLTGSNWSNVVMNVVAGGSVSSLTQALANVPRRFYRIVRLAP